MNPENLASRSVGDVVTEDFRRGAIFKHFGIDFCCGGGKTVADACRAKNVDIEVLAKELDAAGSNEHGRVPAGVSRWSPEFLAQYIVNEHHTYVRSRMPVLQAFTEKVAKVHGHHYTELNAIRDTFADLALELEQHMSTEETDLFPAIASGGPSGQTVQALQALESEHEAAGSAMASIRTLTNDYTPPEGACNTFRAAYAGLAEFEADLHAHVHLENNVLFPKLADRARSTTP